MEWTSLARAATYGCTGCTLHNSLHLRGTHVYTHYMNFPVDGSRVSEEGCLFLICTKEPCRLAAVQDLGKWLGLRGLQHPGEGDYMRTARFLTWATGKPAVPFTKVWNTGEGKGLNLGQVIFKGPESHVGGDIQGTVSCLGL